MKTAVGSLAAAAALLFVLGPSPAWAQATRTWVSGVGNDADPCSRTAPCKTFAGAISKTATGGEIDALDPAGYGAVTITKSITIDGGGEHASILASGTTGIIVNAAGAKVVLRNLSINGTGVTPGFRGIRFLAGASLLVENVIVSGFTSTPGIGISFEASAASKLSLSNVTVVNNTEGIVITSTVAGTKAVLNDVRILHNTGGAGLRVQSNVSATAKNLLASGNSTGITAFATTSAASLDLESCVASNNTNGVVAGLGAGLAFIRLNDCVVSDNTSGLINDANGFIESYQNNRIVGNGTNGAPTGTLPLQ